MFVRDTLLFYSVLEWDRVSVYGLNHVLFVHVSVREKQEAKT